MSELRSHALAPTGGDIPSERSRNADPAVRGAWRILPLEGAYEFSYSDAAGTPSLRRVVAHELKVGPGKVLLGGTELATGEYRGFRADRMHVIEDAATGETVDRNILDWLLMQALRQERRRRRIARRQGGASGSREPSPHDSLAQILIQTPPSA